MPNNETNWTTVSTKTKGKTATSSTKPSTGASAAPVIPKAEVKTIKLSDSAFSAMKGRLDDENEENEVRKPAVSVEKNVPVKVVKTTKPSSNAVTLKQALQNISADKLKELYKSSDDNKTLWIEKVCYWFIEQLKDVTSGANDPTFSKEANSEYPMNALPKAVREYLDEIFDDNKSKLKAIGLCRTAMLHPNADVNAIAGYQVLLQYFLRHLDERPSEAFLTDIDELSGSLKQYPSDKVLRLLWAYSQVQYEQPALALDIWFRLMLPLVENRTYNQFVIEKLSQLTTHNAKNKTLLQSNGAFPMVSFLKLLDFVHRPNAALNKDLRGSLDKSTTILSELFANNPKSISSHGNEYFKSLFPALHGEKQRSSKSPSAIGRMILACMTDKSVVRTWLTLHQKYPQSSLSLLSLLSGNEKSAAGLSSPKDLHAVVQQLQAISNDSNDREEHETFLRDYGKNDTIAVNKSRKSSKSRIGFLFKLIVLLGVAFVVYQHWLWLTVATEYIFEKQLKHPTAVVIRKRLADGFQEAKKFTEISLKNGEAYARSTITKLEPYAIQLGHDLKKRWFLLLKYIEGPVYDKSVEVAEQIQQLSSVIFAKSVHYLNILFDAASYYTAHGAHLTEIYLRQVYAILHDKWTHFDASALRSKFDELRMKVVKSV